MAGFKFTEDTVAEATCPPGKKDVLVFCTQQRGLGLRVSANGKRSFLVQYTSPAGKRRLPLGSHGAITVKDARKAASAIIGQVAAGKDPVAEDRKKAQVVKAEQEAASFTFGRLIDEWVKARTDDRRPGYLKEARATVLRNLADWRARPAGKIQPTEVAHALDRIKREKSTISANRTLSYARAAYGWAVKRRLLDANPFQGIERPGREQSRERVLGPEELGAIWRACDALSPAHAGFVQVLMLTLGRRDEVASMQWSEIDNPSQPTTWTLPRSRSKNGRTHVVHLSEPARAIIAAQPRIAKNPHVFTGRAIGHVSAYSRSKALLDAELAKQGQEPAPWTFHDFRRAGLTILAGMGVPPHIADKLLNHVTGTISGVAAVYNRASFAAERQAALDTWARLILAAAAGQEIEGNVVPLARAG